MRLNAFGEAITGASKHIKNKKNLLVIDDYYALNGRIILTG